MTEVTHIPRADAPPALVDSQVLPKPMARRTSPGTLTLRWIPTRRTPTPLLTAIAFPEDVARPPANRTVTRSVAIDTYHSLRLPFTVTVRQTTTKFLI